MRLQHISVIAGISVLYGAVGFGNFLLTPEERYVDVRTWVDALIPFQAAFAWPYLFYYMLLGMPLVLLPAVAELHVLWKRVAWASAISALVFIAFPTHPLRMANVEEMPGLAPWIIAMIYKIDPPANCFPSLHVLHSFLIAASYHRIARFRVWGVVFYMMAVGVALATVFIKQHYAADVVAGLLLVPVICALAQLTPAKIRRSKELVAAITSRRQS